MLRYTFLLSAIMTALCIMGFFLYTNLIVKRQTYDDAENSLTRFDLQLAAYRDQAALLSADPDMRSYLEDRKEAGGVYARLYAFIHAQRVRGVFYLLDAEGRVLLTSDPNKARPRFLRPDAVNAHFFRQMCAQPARVVVDTVDLAPEKRRQTAYVVGSAVSTGQSVEGFILFELSREDMRRFLTGGRYDSLVVTDPFHTVIAATNDAMADGMNKFDPAIEDNRVELGGTPYFIIESTSRQFPIKQFALRSLRAQRELMRLLLFSALLLPALMCLVGYFLSDRLSRANTESIRRLLQAMRTPSLETLDHRIHLSGGDEFEIIADRYNALMARIEQLIATLNESNERQRLTEIKHLEEQFNPHFIFNVLESIKCMAITDEPKRRIVDTVTALARLMRYSIDFERSMVALDDDIAYIRDYLAIQKTRFGERLTYHIDAAPPLGKRTIPKLLLQPLVENSIKYGYRRKESLTLWISAAFRASNVVLTVRDDGDGVEPSFLAEWNEALSSPAGKDKARSAHLGLYNVHRRLQLTYGEHAAGLAISSVPGEGTTVELTIPNEEAATCTKSSL